jgi:hypothetical protein
MSVLKIDVKYVDGMDCNSSEYGWFSEKNYKPWSTTEGADFLDKLSDCKLLIITYSL